MIHIEKDELYEMYWGDSHPGTWKEIDEIAELIPCDDEEVQECLDRHEIPKRYINDYLLKAIFQAFAEYDIEEKDFEFATRVSGNYCDALLIQKNLGFKLTGIGKHEAGKTIMYVGKYQIVPLPLFDVTPQQMKTIVSGVLESNGYERKEEEETAEASYYL